MLEVVMCQQAPLVYLYQRAHLCISLGIQRFTSVPRNISY